MSHELDGYNLKFTGCRRWKAERSQNGNRNLQDGAVYGISKDEVLSAGNRYP